MTGGFGSFVRAAHAAGDLVVQPRMGMSDPVEMRRGLLATKRADATTVGTITLDSYTRVGDIEAARRALARGGALNGYPIVNHGSRLTRRILDGVADPGFPVQVRHGSAQPEAIFEALVASGLTATEGGPVSYCLPYSRAPLTRSVASWSRCCEIFAQLRDQGQEPHLETFGGCMMGQLCPPGLLVALSVLEAVFFREHGLRSISLSYAQQTSTEQDEEALHALARLAGELLPDVDWHIVLYAYMGVYPRTEDGALLLLERAARLAARAGAARIIVKTAAEAHRIPTVEENVTALELASAAAADERSRIAARAPRTPVPAASADTGVYAEASLLVRTVLDLAPDVGRALVRAFGQGLIDVPFCLHPDNHGQSRARVDGDGRLRWTEIGAMPIGGVAEITPGDRLTSDGLLSALSHVQRGFDELALRSAAGPRGALPGRRPVLLP
ncbi:methylaspartate mutase [Streptomyces sp. NPDC090025]|uniref:methylaspartate mutase n=1 Tax=Streptomyces sp. NPDC090025 TaxID=3365922 RepID=UPI003837011B